MHSKSMLLRLSKMLLHRVGSSKTALALEDPTRTLNIIAESEQHSSKSNLFKA